MVLLIRSFAGFAGLISLVFLVRPDYATRYIEFWKYDRRIFIGAIIKLISGIVFLIGASQCRLPQVIIIFGILSIITSFLIVVLGYEKMDDLLVWCSNMNVIILRIVSSIGIAVCLFILYSA